MREGLSKKQRQDIGHVQRIKTAQCLIRGMKLGQRWKKEVRSFNAIPNESTSAPVMQNYQQTSFMAAPTASQAQILAPQQARQPYGLDPLPYNKLFGPHLVYSALQQVNTMLEAFGINARCNLGGMDAITLQRSHSIQMPPNPPGCTPLSLANLPYDKLAGPALVNEALQQVNELTGSLWPGQFVLNGKDLILLQP